MVPARDVTTTHAAVSTVIVRVSDRKSVLNLSNPPWRAKSADWSNFG